MCQSLLAHPHLSFIQYWGLAQITLSKDMILRVRLIIHLVFIVSVLTGCIDVSAEQTFVQNV